MAFLELICFFVSFLSLLWFVSVFPDDVLLDTYWYLIPLALIILSLSFMILL